jgi:ComF family protein
MENTMNILWVKAILSGVIDAVLPPRCALSGEVVDKQGMLSPHVWAQLRFIADPLCLCCGYPFEFEIEKGAMCGACLGDPPSFSMARAALVYDDASRAAILKFKHADRIEHVHSFVPWLMRAGAEVLEGVDMIVPVPLHRWRLLKRRYNQAALLAQVLAKSAGKTVVLDALTRQRATPSQGHLGVAERQKNVKNAFVVNPKRLGSLKGRSVVLVDDVYTTGATVSACAEALKRGGAADVRVLAVARVVKTSG